LGEGLNSSAQCQADRLDHTLKIFNYLMVPNAQETVAFGFQPDRPCRVPCLVMLATVQLDDQHPLNAKEIHNVRGNGRLPTKFEALDLTVTNGCPDLALRIRGIAAKFSGVRAGLTANGTHKDIV